MEKSMRTIPRLALGAVITLPNIGVGAMERVIRDNDVFIDDQDFLVGGILNGSGAVSNSWKALLT
jgi:hypothetical protein